MPRPFPYDDVVVNRRCCPTRHGTGRSRLKNEQNRPAEREIGRSQIRIGDPCLLEQRVRQNEVGRSGNQELQVRVRACLHQHVQLPTERRFGRYFQDHAGDCMKKLSNADNHRDSDDWPDRYTSDLGVFRLANCPPWSGRSVQVHEGEFSPVRCIL